jgi:hypothetical protein
MRTRRACIPFYIKSNSKGMRTSSSVQAAVDSFGGYSFAYRESVFNSTNHLVESRKTCSLTPGDALLVINLIVHNPRCVPAFVDTIGVELLFIPAYSSSLNRIERSVFARDT